MLWGPWVLLAGLAGFGFVIRTRLEPIVAGMVYWFLWATFILLGAAVWESLRGKGEGESVVGKGEEGRGKGEARSGRGEGERALWQILRPWLVPAGVGLALTSLCYLSVEPAFPVLADETNQLDASLSLYLDRTLRLVTQGSNYFGGFHTILAEPSHRAGLFPFCMSLLHSLLGYSGYHGFVVNFVAAALTLAVVVRFGQKVGNTAYGLIAAVLLAAFPLYALTITSSAFEVLNVLLITLVFYQLHRFWGRPDGPNAETLLLLTALASQCRYETVILVLPVGLALYLKWRVLAGARPSWRLAVAPLLFLPVLWQRVAMGGKGLGTVAGDQAFFSVGYLFRNIANNVEFFLNPGFREYPSSPVVFVLAVIGGGLLLKEWYGRKIAAADCSGGLRPSAVLSAGSFGGQRPPLQGPLTPASCGLVALGLAGIAAV
jgi:hypothetical protein